MNFYRAGDHILNMEHVLAIAQQQEVHTNGQPYFTYLVMLQNGACPTTITLTQRELEHLKREVDGNYNPWRAT